MSLYANIGGGSKQLTSLYTNINGSSKAISKMYTNINGSMKKIFPETIYQYTWYKYKKNVSGSGEKTGVTGVSHGSGSFTNFFQTMYYASSYTIQSLYNNEDVKIALNNYKSVRIDSICQSPGSSNTNYADYWILYFDPFDITDYQSACKSNTMLSFGDNEDSNGMIGHYAFFKVKKISKSSSETISSSQLTLEYSDSIYPSYTYGSQTVTWEYVETLTSTNINAYSTGVTADGNYKIEYIGKTEIN